MYLRKHDAKLAGGADTRIAGIVAGKPIAVFSPARSRKLNLCRFASNPPGQCQRADEYSPLERRRRFSSVLELVNRYGLRRLNHRLPIIRQF
jgi:hypothetical protein